MTDASDDTPIGFFANLWAWWLDLEWYFRFVIGALVFLIISGFTGMDGGSPKKKLFPKTVEEVTDEENPRVFLDVEIDGKPAGRLVIECFFNFCPVTAENFKRLCTGEMGVGKKGKPLHYKGSTFHRIIPGFMIQGGDFTNGDGTGGESMYGHEFPDEFTNGYIPHAGPGLLSSANSGPNTNGSQFFITTAKCEWLDQKHVVFGQVVDGFRTVVAMNKVGSKSGKPSKTVVIKDCGLVDKVKDKKDN